MLKQCWVGSPVLFWFIQQMESYYQYFFRVLRGYFWMIELVSIYHHFYPQCCSGGSDFCRMNVNPEFAFILVYFQSQKNRDQNTEMYGGLRQLGGHVHLRHSYLFRPWRGHRKLLVALVLTDAESETQRSQDTCLRSHNCMVVVLKIGIRSFVLGLRYHLCNHRISQNWGLATPRECWGRVHVISSVQ